MFFLAIFAIALCSVSCKGGLPKNYFEYTAKPFKAEVEGSVDGLRFSARIFCDFSADNIGDLSEKVGEAENNDGSASHSGSISEKKGDRSPVISVEYTSPESLKGISVTLFSDGSSSARLGEISANDRFKNMAIHFLALAPIGDIFSVEQTEGGYIIIYSVGDDSLTYIFEEDGVYPSSVSGSFCDREIVLNIKGFEFVE